MSSALSLGERVFRQPVGGRAWRPTDRVRGGFWATPAARSWRREGERGQTMVFVLLALSLFLLAAVGFTVDIANLWFHRQMAQNAADAACTAGIMDMYEGAVSGTFPTTAHFTSGTAFDCGTTTPNTAKTSPTPCWYASTNGYPSPSTFSGLAAGKASNNVYGSFPASVPGAGATTGYTSPFLRIDVLDRVQVFFMALLTGSKTQDVRAFAECGLQVTRVPIPIAVLAPTGNSLNLSGTPTIAIYGGPSMGLVVNSSSATAASGGGTIDFSQGGPNLTGSSVGVFGGPSTSCCSFNGGTTGTWLYPYSPVSDPFASIPAPSIPGNTPPPSGVSVGSGVNGCPDAGGCKEYVAGYYPGGISVKNQTAIFDPGVYYVVGGLALQANSTVRPSTATGDGSGGTMFYFSGTGSVSVAANSGGTTYAFNTTSGTGSLANGLKCTATSSLPGNIGATLSVGNMLLAPCTGTYGDPLVALGLPDPSGTQRGLLFFQDRSAKSVAADWGGGGTFALVGSMYFHSCNASGTGTGCGSTYYSDTFSFGGNSGSGSYVLGNIITDNLGMHGTPGIMMDLSPDAAYNVLKVSLLR